MSDIIRTLESRNITYNSIMLLAFKQDDCVLTKAEPEPATWFHPTLKPELLTNKPVATSLFKSITNVLVCLTKECTLLFSFTCLN